MSLAAVLSTLMITAQLAAAEDDAPPALKDRSTAFALSVGGTALSAGLSVAGIATGNEKLFVGGVLSSLVTPSAGEIYAGRYLTWGQAIRAVSAGVEIAGMVEAYRCFSAAFGFARPSCHDNPALASALLISGMVGYSAGIIYDIATAGSAVDRYNERHHLQITPVAGRTADAGSMVGVVIRGAF